MIIHPIVLIPKIIIIVLLVVILIVIWGKVGTAVWFAYLAGAVIIFLLLSIIFWWLFAKFAAKSRSGLGVILTSDEKKEKGFHTGIADLKLLIGKEGIAATTLRPSGIVTIDDERYSAVSEAEFLPKGTKIIVKKVEGNKIVVRSIKS